MKNVIVDKEKILDLIRNQFTQVINNNLGLYSDVTLIIDDEIQFTKIKDKEEGAIYIAVKFNSISFDYGETNLLFIYNYIFHYSLLTFPFNLFSASHCFIDFVMIFSIYPLCLPEKPPFLLIL